MKQKLQKTFILSGLARFYGDMQKYMKMVLKLRFLISYSLSFGDVSFVTHSVPLSHFSYSLFYRLYLQQTPHFVILSHNTPKLNIYPLLLFQNPYSRMRQTILFLSSFSVRFMIFRFIPDL